MTNEDRKAEALARWLDADPGQEPPADLDADVVEAVYSLSPDRVPTPRVSADEIIQLVTSGPLVSGSPDPLQALQEADAEVVPFPVPQQPVALAPASQGRQANNVWWLGGGAVTLLAAAVALVVVLPGLFTFDAAPDTQSSPFERSVVADAPSPVPTPSAVANEPALAVVDRKRAVRPSTGGGANEVSKGIELSIITESGDGIDDDAVADLGDVGLAGDGLLDLSSDEDLMRSDAELSQVAAAAPSSTAAADQPPIVIRGASARSVSPSRAAPSEAKGVESGLPLSAVAKPSPWPSSRTEAGQLLSSAKKHLDAGRLERAQQAAQMGLDLEYRNTPVRSALLWVRGQAQAGQGKASAATKSYNEAAELNSTR